jgi:4,5-DOPA dioxygenase extradiol
MIGSASEGDPGMGGESARMPSIFLGHGTPLNALADNRWTQTWARVGREIGRPKAIVAISGHWCTYGVGVTAMARPPTIHDFGGFPQALFDIRYPAPGDPQLAARIRDMLAPVTVVLDEQSWGLDHGTWSVLCKAYPAADIPVIQLSIDATQPPQFHFDLGAKLAPLRDEGVLILGSGNIVHNLAVFRRHADDFAYDWAQRFNDYIRDKLLAHDFPAIVDYASRGEDAAMSVPTPDHYCPLLYAAGAAGADRATIESDGVFQASMSMLSVSFGPKPLAAQEAHG